MFDSGCVIVFMCLIHVVVCGLFVTVCAMLYDVLWGCLCLCVLVVVDSAWMPCLLITV